MLEIDISHSRLNQEKGFYSPQDQRGNDFLSLFLEWGEDKD
jgi:hypothetical protein